MQKNYHVEFNKRLHGTYSTSRNNRICFNF